ncbi:Methyltransferase domain-containing protein [Geoalkalibacter ferrihydriticus]|uniref:Methyltransferase domain-containing protein n=1 Tax=Geoalkalibacter ferrihydriticus TaxID=392333 RepID=A0A1G9UWP3_9BACT|nr:methyltransferase domain-containing protein [Geoalkalibacter ferrihydriticus]SDM64240.1 Methyltransferase domain-containing protein [Geoalkalibacter ferrihydriticus]
MINKNEKYYSFERKDLVAIVPLIEGAVLDVGCGDGATMAYLLGSGINDVTGIECDYNAYIRAKNKGFNVINADIEKDSIDLEEKKYDFILFGDVLEHLYDPWNTLDKFKKFLKKDGTFLISIPNIKHYRILRKFLFSDEWRYTEAGILDITHIRFFTRKEALRMIEESGLQVSVLKYKTNKNILFRVVSLFAKNWVMTIWPEQFLIAAKVK